MTKADIIREYGDVLTVNELAETCDCSVNYVRGVMRGHRRSQVSGRYVRHVTNDAEYRHQAEKSRAKRRRFEQGMY